MPSGLLVHRAVVHSVDVATGACKVRIPSILGGQVVTVDPASGTPPLVGTKVTVCSTSDLSEFFFIEAVGGGGGGGGGGTDEVWVGPSPPTDPNIELWYDTDAIAVPAPASAGYVHTQAVSASVWTINHNLGFFPNVTVISGGSTVEGDIVYVNTITMTITFSVSITGIAYLS